MYVLPKAKNRLKNYDFFLPDVVTSVIMSSVTRQSAILPSLDPETTN